MNTFYIFIYKFIFFVICINFSNLFFILKFIFFIKKKSKLIKILILLSLKINGNYLFIFLET